MKPGTRQTIAVAVAALGIAPLGALAQSETYFSRYDGGWEGGGSVQIEQLPKPVDVSCDMSGAVEAETEFKLSGNCSAMLVLNRDIGAELTLDPETGEYNGVYTGSGSGPAKLNGKRDGATLDLQVTWNKTIYDDNTARMTIENQDGEAFVMKVIEKIEGEDVVVSDLEFTRKGA
ncbi:hypothetical protein U0C82_16620 [Fulvimarina sp. 2208YS6-2-32]|uniref:Secreted protein n=1 Tax=Fulvimarina uroteuthidis TaxID=3098149 RepID=A0ABU5I5X5_9HYPH|nr:hypothetical protein [Fulvimarina sp. 2208YS6-2-32]MDY8110767.1 hypothetical protein [Fulvimarina sp. 2208YS6-2-32]